MNSEMLTTKIKPSLKVTSRTTKQVHSLFPIRINQSMEIQNQALLYHVSQVLIKNNLSLSPLFHLRSISWNCNRNILIRQYITPIITFQVLKIIILMIDSQRLEAAWTSIQIVSRKRKIKLLKIYPSNRRRAREVTRLKRYRLKLNWRHQKVLLQWPTMVD